jgi:death-on-curing protein
MNEPHWLERRAILLLHAEAIAAHGGVPGLRDAALLDSALARPINQFLYNAAADLAQLAAAYGFGLAKNHAFADGNKRIAFIATALFLRRNGYRLTSAPIQEVSTMMSLAAGEISEDEFATWIRTNTQISAI